MPLSAAERMSFGIQCPRCGKLTEKPVAWLSTFETLRCATPGCGHNISLAGRENRALIEILVDQAEELDALMSGSKKGN